MGTAGVAAPARTGSARKSPERTGNAGITNNARILMSSFRQALRTRRSRVIVTVLGLLPRVRLRRLWALLCHPFRVRGNPVSFLGLLCGPILTWRRAGPIPGELGILQSIQRLGHHLGGDA